METEDGQKKEDFYLGRVILKGAKTLEKILKKAWEMKIPYFTFWGSSLDNITKRPKEEVRVLLSLYQKYFKKLLKEKRIFEEKVRVNIFGRWKEIFPKKLKETISEIIKKTKNHDRYFLTFLLAYNGTDEMLEAIKKISKKRIKKIDEKILLENLWTGSLPPVDLVIRTGCEGDPHNSAGFMMWHTAYSQFYFTKTFFPDFSPEEFEKIINDYLKRERRFGK
jgi:tritrans,polycis-undecaprenyl-diphosphate synthase [geranylgeranyl-diphosphate specific]